MAAAALPIGMMVASQVFQGVTQDQAAHQAAQVDDANAQRTELIGALQGQQVRDQARAVQGEAISALAADGVSVGTGSALDLLHQNAKAAEMEILNRQYSAESQAQTYRVRAASERAAGTAALFGGILRAGAQAVTMGARMNPTTAPGGQSMPIPLPLSGATGM